MDSADHDAEVAHERLFDGTGQEGLDWLIARGLSLGTIKKARLGSKPEGINIPYINPDGSVRINRTRYLHPTRNKYHTPKGGGTHIYQVGNTRHSNLWATEGEFDALILTQLGLNSIGLPGANAFKSEWRYLFSYTENLTVVADGDEAGRNAARRVGSIVGPVVGNIRIVDMPPDFDVTDMYLRDPAALREMVRW